jgi:protein-S-isoprenylcysteine O-methyltransferase Ste14
MSLLHIYLMTLIPLLLGSWMLYRTYLKMEYKRNQSLSAIPSIVQAALFFAWGGYPAIYLKKDWPITYVSPISRLIGQIGLGLGLLIIVGGMVYLGIRRSFGMNVPRLHQSGVYKFSRNPQVMGCFLYIISFILLWPSWYAIGWGASLAIILHIMVKTEETHLKKVHGVDYLDYCKMVPRYIKIL